MTARRSSSDPVSHYLETGERIVWRHQPSPRALFFNRLPAFIIILAMTGFVVVVGLNVVGNSLGSAPIEVGPWLVLPAAACLFFLVLLTFFLSFLWNHFRGLLDSSSTHYALTDRRFLVVSERGMIEYDASYFKVMEASGGEAGRQVLLFDYGPSGRHKRDGFRDRIAALPNAKKLEQLIGETLRP